MRDRSLLSDVADAVAGRQEVDWERCAERAQPAERPRLDHLRTFAAICRAAGPRPAAAAGPGDAAGPRFSRRALGALVAVALAQSVFGLVTGAALLPAATAGMLATLAEPGPAAAARMAFLPVEDMTPATLFFRLIPHALYPLCGLLLYVGGRFDRRARLLGVVLMLLGAFWAQPVVGGFGIGLYPELFLPAALWMFVRAFPQRRRRTRLDDAATGMVVVTASFGVLLQLANLPPAQALGPPLTLLAREVPGTYVAPLFFGPHCVFVLAALVVLLLRARGVAQAERRRTWLFVAGLVAALAPHVEGAVEVALPGTVTVAAANWVSVLGSVSALAVPCLTMYAAVALRVLDVRTTVRVSARRLLTRGGLAVLTAGPLAALGGLIASRAYWSVGDMLADPLAQGSAATAGVAVAALAFRERLLAGVDVWIAPESGEQRRVLAAAGAELAQATHAGEVAAVVARATRRGAGASATVLAAADASGAHGHQFRAVAGESPPLPRASMLVQVLEEVGAPLAVAPQAPHTVFELLPADEAAWVAASGAATVVRVPGAEARTAGILAVGRRSDGARLRPVDLAFLDALAAATGLALARLSPAAGSAPHDEQAPARVCRRCGLVAAPVDAGEQCGDCGGEWAVAPTPAVLAGKFQVLRRLGAGGMGTVFLARDLGLDRLVALKTLEGVSPTRLARLKPEAQALAASAHPGVAQTYGLETWRGRPLLVMEHLDGGTLAARLADGPLPPAEAVRVALAVAEALAALHAADFRHGDVKPSNIGFTADGTVKLLDFGLAGPRDAGPTLGGTVPYLSPEALAGAPAGTADDLWALTVVLYEMAVGQRPFDGATRADVAVVIQRQRLRPRPSAPADGKDGDQDAREALRTFASGLLTAPPSARPATAEALAVALRACVARPDGP